ncbi:hypothetical protein GCM10022248_94020 [Nonomuraea soli]
MTVRPLLLADPHRILRGDVREHGDDHGGDGGERGNDRAPSDRSPFTRLSGVALASLGELCAEPFGLGLIAVCACTFGD